MLQAREQLNSKGIHASVQRIAIMDYLLKNPIHPTADEIFSALSSSMPTLSKTTVYNTLRLFEQRHAVQAITIDEKNLRYDANTEDHAHFRCTCCNRIFDFPLAKDIYSAARMPQGFCLSAAELYLKGLCGQCAAAQGDPSTKN